MHFFSKLSKIKENYFFSFTKETKETKSNHVKQRQTIFKPSQTTSNKTRKKRPEGRFLSRANPSYMYLNYVQVVNTRGSSALPKD